MKNILQEFKLNSNKCYEYDIKITLQSGEYTGTFTANILENKNIYNMLQSKILNASKIFTITENTCDYEEYQDDNGVDRFRATLTNKNGKRFIIDDKYSFLEDYIAYSQTINRKEFDAIKKITHNSGHWEPCDNDTVKTNKS